MGVIDGLRAWMRLGRLHTLILEAPLAVLGAALALGTIWDIRIIYWLIFGGIYHAVGYGMNSYVDWKKGFDKDDPRKQHHPLNQGTIEPESAKIVIYIVMLGLILYGLVLGNFSLIAFLSLIVMVVSGVSYNYFGKYISVKFIPISIVHTMVFVYPYILYRGLSNFPSSNIDYLFIFMTAAYFTHHSYQILLSGDVKDMDQDEASLIKKLGATLSGGLTMKPVFNPGILVLSIAYILVVLEIAFTALGVFIPFSVHSSMILIAILGTWMIYEAGKVVEKGQFMREKRVVHMSRKELAGYLTVHAATIPVLGYEAFIALTVFMFGYLFTTSKFLWGNYLKPEV